MANELPIPSPAGRIAWFAARMRDTSGKKTISDAWAHIFEIHDPKGIRRDREVAHHVSLLHDQLTTLKSQLAKRTMRSKKYEAHLAEFEQTLQIQTLAAAWNTVSQRLTPAVMAVLEMLPDYVEPEEESLEPKVLQDIRERLGEWETQVRASALPQSVQEFLLWQLGLILRAVREYPVRGAEAFRQSAQESAAAWVEHSEELASYAQAPEVVGVREVWPTIEKWGRRVVLVGRVAKLFFIDGPAIAERVAELIQAERPIPLLPGPAEIHQAVDGVDFEVMPSEDEPDDESPKTA